MFDSRLPSFFSSSRSLNKHLISLIQLSSESWQKKTSGRWLRRNRGVDLYRLNVLLLPDGYARCAMTQSRCIHFKRLTPKPFERSILISAAFRMEHSPCLHSSFSAKCVFLNSSNLKPNQMSAR